jgi:hypothetical protein
MAAVRFPEETAEARVVETVAAEAEPASAAMNWSTPRTKG